MTDVLTLYNTETRQHERFSPADPRHVTFYTCGPTVYDDAHIGNFRSFLAGDLLRRWLESPLCRVTGPDGSPHEGPRKVTHVMNITDVGHMTEDDVADGGGEDKMEVAGKRLEEAKKSGRLPEGADVDPNDPRAIAAFYTERFQEDARKLGVKVALEAQKDPSLMPCASDAVPGMIRSIERLVETGFAYVGGEPGARAVYFDVEKAEEYGRLSGNTLDQVRGGAGGRVSSAHLSEKRNPADFLLWKEDPRHLMKWESPWGEGYPGWHIECTVMSFARLIPGGLDRVLAQPGSGFAIDVHSGGEDNIFPHHECEIAQSCALTGGRLFARHWLHARFLMVEGQKMSKSKGNFYTPRQLMAEGIEPAAIRLELLKTHYRANADFSMEGLKASARTVDRWRRLLVSGSDQAEAPADHPVLAALADALHDDLNVAGALGEINKWAGGVDAPTPTDGAAMRLMDDVLGVLSLERAAQTATAIGVFVGVEPDPAVEALLAERAAARKAKDFARADVIRDELAGLGLAIKDAAGGKVEVSRA